MKFSDRSFVYLEHLNANANLRMGCEWNSFREISSGGSFYWWCWNNRK